MPNLIKSHVYVTFPGVGELEVFPKNDSIKYGWERTNDVWRKKVNTKLWFINEPNGGTHTFDIFASLELEECGCHRLDMRITLECSGEETLLFPGILFFIDGEWFFDFCSVQIDPRVNDPFECLFSNWETDINVLIGPGIEQALNVDSGNYEQVTCTEFYFGEPYPGDPLDRRNIYEDDCLSGYDGDDWQVLIHQISTVGSGMDELIVQTTWIREVFAGAGPPPGGGWTQATPTLWTRPVILQGPTIEEDFETGIYIATWTVVNGILDNGRLLKDVLIYLFDPCDDYQLRSDFLGIDPDGEAPANQAYAYAKTWIWNAVVFQMSDVVRPDVFQNATKGFISLKHLLDCLKMNWRLFLYFDETNQVYRIEHISFERHAKLINLVVKRPDAIRGYNSYTYDKIRIPQKETFKWSFQTNDEDWDNASIVYPDCNDVGNIKEYKIDCYHTDFQSLFESEIQDIDLLKGLMIVSQKDGEINRGTGDISGLIKANAGLSWANVVRYLWRWKMPSCTALVNGVTRNFLSLIPKIRQTGFQAELCCMDILQINPAIDRVRTGLGNGEMEPFEIDLSSGMANFDLLFAPPIINDIEIPDVVIESIGGNCVYDYFTFSLSEEINDLIDVAWDFGVDAIPPTETGQGPHIVYYESAGTKHITCTLTSGGNIVVLMFIVEVIECPITIIGPDEDVCTWHDIEISLDTYIGDAGTVEWDFGVDAVPPDGTGEGPFTIYYETPGAKTITATITYPNHEEIIEFSVTVVDCPIHIVVDDNTVCYYTNVMFSLDMPLEPGVTVDWNFGSGAVPPTGTGEGPISVYWTTDGTKTITATIDYGTHIEVATTTVTVSACPGNIGGHVYKEGPVGLVAINVKLFHDDNMDGISDGGAAVKSVFTNLMGVWAMVNVLPGNYVIVVILPGSCYEMSEIDQSKDYTPDGDAAPDISLFDTVIPVTITPLKIDTGNDFYLHFFCGQIKGIVTDNREEFIAGATITLYHDNDLDGVADDAVVVASTVTLIDGTYTLNNIPIGDYVIVLTVPSGYGMLSAADGSPDGDAGTDVSGSDNVIPCTITDGKIDLDNDFIIEFI